MAKNSATRLIEEKEHFHKIAKLWVWIVWFSTMLLAAAYCVISILSFEHIMSVYNSDDDLVDDHELWAFLGSTIIAPAMVIGFYFFGTMVLLKKTISEDGMSYSYGALHFSTIWMSALVLLSGVSIHAYKDRMKVWEQVSYDLDSQRVDNWDGGKTTQAQVTYVLAYILSLVFFCLFIFLFIFRSAAKRLIIDPKLKKQEEEEQRAIEEQALLKAQFEQQQKAGTVAVSPDEKGKKPVEAAGSEIKPDAAVKVEEKKVEEKPVAKVEVKPEEKPEEKKVEEKKPEEEKPEPEKKSGGWWSRKPKAAESKDSAAVRTPEAAGPDQVV